jgi:hypothetical protein
MSIFKIIAKLATKGANVAKVATKYAPIIAVVLAAAKDVKAELKKPNTPKA